jgi:hypothetical protein
VVFPETELKNDEAGAGNCYDTPMSDPGNPWTDLIERAQLRAECAGLLWKNHAHRKALLLDLLEAGDIHEALSGLWVVVHQSGDVMPQGPHPDYLIMGSHGSYSTLDGLGGTLDELAQKLKRRSIIVARTLFERMISAQETRHGYSNYKRVDSRNVTIHSQIKPLHEMLDQKNDEWNSIAQAQAKLRGARLNEQTASARPSELRSRL